MKEQELFEHYISIGVIELSGVNEDGEPMYRLNEAAKDLAPELWEMHLSMVDETILELFQKDLVEIEYDEELNANIRLSPLGIELLKELGFNI